MMSVTGSKLSQGLERIASLNVTIGMNVQILTFNNRIIYVGKVYQIKKEGLRLKLKNKMGSKEFQTLPWKDIRTICKEED